MIRPIGCGFLAVVTTYLKVFSFHHSQQWDKRGLVNGQPYAYSKNHCARHEEEEIEETQHILGYKWATIKSHDEF